MSMLEYILQLNSVNYLIIILGIIGFIRYVYAVVTGKTYSSFASWFVFSLELFAIFFSAYKLGARESLLLILLYAVMNLVHSILALKYGDGQFKLSKFDKILLSVSVLGVILWIITSNPWYCFILNVGIDLLGYLILLNKLYKHPNSEDAVAWLIAGITYALNLILIKNWVVQEYLYSLINFVLCLLIVILNTKFKKNFMNILGEKN